MAMARAALTDAEYEAARARGAAMSADEALGHLLDEIDRVLADQQDRGAG